MSVERADSAEHEGLYANTTLEGVSKLASDVQESDELRSVVGESPNKVPVLVSIGGSPLLTELGITDVPNFLWVRSAAVLPVLSLGTAGVD